jgi:hypothetical protein
MVWCKPTVVVFTLRLVAGVASALVMANNHLGLPGMENLHSYHSLRWAQWPVPIVHPPTDFFIRPLLRPFLAPA